MDSTLLNEYNFSPFLRAILISICTVFLFVSCTLPIHTRGNLLQPDEIAKIIPGYHNRIDIIQMFGSPSVLSTFDNNKWYYIGQRHTQLAFLDPVILERTVLEIVFGEDGTVETTRVYTKEDGRDIEMVDHGSHTSWRADLERLVDSIIILPLGP